VAPLLLLALSACSSGDDPTVGSEGSDPGAASPEVAVPVPAGPVPPGFSPLSASFLTPLTGWALGSSDCGQPPCTTLVRTADAGRTWGAVEAPPADTQGFGDGNVTDVRFGSASDGFAYGGGLFATHDGARTWTKVPVDGDVEALAVGGGRVWVVVAGSCGEEGCAGPASLLSGPLGGGALTPVPGVSLPGRGLDRVTVSGSSVYASGADDTSSVLWAGTLDGTFTRRSLPCAAGAVPSLAAPATPVGSAALVCAAETETAVVRQAFTSTDAGAAWTRVGDPPQVEGGTVLAASPDALYVSDGTTGVSASRDGGRTWEPSLKTAEGGASYVSFVDNAFGFALAQTGPETSGLLLTTDAGRTWTPTTF